MPWWGTDPAHWLCHPRSWGISISCCRGEASFSSCPCGVFRNARRFLHYFCIGILAEGVGYPAQIGIPCEKSTGISNAKKQFSLLLVWSNDPRKRVQGMCEHPHRLLGERPLLHAPRDGHGVGSSGSSLQRAHSSPLLQVPHPRLAPARRWLPAAPHHRHHPGPPRGPSCPPASPLWPMWYVPGQECGVHREGWWVSIPSLVNGAEQAGSGCAGKGARLGEGVTITIMCWLGCWVQSRLLQVSCRECL